MQVLPALAEDVVLIGCNLKVIFYLCTRAFGVLPQGQGDEFHHGSPVIDPEHAGGRPKPPDIYVPDLNIDRPKVKPLDFR